MYMMYADTLPLLRRRFSRHLHHMLRGRGRWCASDIWDTLGGLTLAPLVNIYAYFRSSFSLR